jgi:hypothetical protein
LGQAEEQDRLMKDFEVIWVTGTPESKARYKDENNIEVVKNTTKYSHV